MLVRSFKALFGVPGQRCCLGVGFPSVCKPIVRDPCHNFLLLSASFFSFFLLSDERAWATWALRSFLFPCDFSLASLLSPFPPFYYRFSAVWDLLS